MNIGRTLALSLANALRGANTGELSIHAGAAPTSLDGTLPSALIRYQALSLTVTDDGGHITVRAGATVTAPQFSFALASGAAGFAVLQTSAGRMLLSVGDAASSAEVKLSQVNLSVGERYALVGLQIAIPYL